MPQWVAVSADTAEGRIQMLLSTRVLRRAVGLVAATSAMVLGVSMVLRVCSPAFADPTLETFYPAVFPVVFGATDPAGHHFTFKVRADNVDLLGPNSRQGLPDPPRGEAYFEVWLQIADPPPGTPFVPLSVPDANVSLTTSAGISNSVTTNASWQIEPIWYFVVPDSITRAVLKIAGSTVTYYGPDNSATNYTIDPEEIDFVIDRPTYPAAKTFGFAHSRSQTSAVNSDKEGASAEPSIVTGVGGAVVLGIAIGSAVSFRRRRAFYRADRDGRIVLVGPALGMQLAGERGAGPEGLDEAPGRAIGAIVAKLLGPLDITGARRPTEQISGPVKEIVVFLVLNPGQQFTSIQLRESIWFLGREPLGSPTFRKYMVELRKAFGPGVVVTNKYRYELTDAVNCDLYMFRDAVAKDPVGGAEEALDLVRGPVLHGSFDGKNSPFAWAMGIANNIENEVVDVAHDFAVACLDGSDPARADAALEKALCCATSNLRLRICDLNVAAALGGPSAVFRALEEGRAAMVMFKADVVRLEKEARALGWETLSL